MDSADSELKEFGANISDGNGGLSKVVFRPYIHAQDYTSLAIMFKDYRIEVNGCDLNELVEVGGEKPYKINRIEGEILSYIYEEKCGVMIAELDNRPIGFMMYHYIFSCILIVRNVYFVREYRKRSLLRAMTFSVGNVSRVFSQTFSGRQPKEIQGEKKNRHHIYSGYEFDVWENIISPRNRSNKKWVQDQSADSKE